MLLDNRKAEPRTLGEAIRRGWGCELRPEQCRAGLYHGDSAACALGAAYLGVGIDTNQHGAASAFALMQRFGLTYADLERLTIMNDFQCWTREQIADYCDANGIGVPAVTVGNPEGK